MIRQNEAGSAGFAHVVFICKGNICRSAFAEYYLRSILPFSSATIESCGLDVDQGHISPSFAVKAAEEYGLCLEKHRSKGLRECDLQGADVVFLMEYEQFLRFNRLYPQFTEKTMLLRRFSPWPDRLFCNIYDPYGLPIGEFRRCFRLMAKALDRLAKHQQPDASKTNRL